MRRVEPISARKRKRQILVGALFGLLAAGGWSAARTATADTHPNPARDIAGFTTSIKDLETSVDVTRYEAKELEKIGPDFTRTYALRHLTFLYKQPDKICLQGKSPILGPAKLVLNGSTRFYTVPKLHIRKTEDLEHTPSRRQSLLEYGGLVSADTLRFMQGRFVHEEALDGHPAAVFDMTYQGVENGSHYRLWIDPQTHITRRRDWFDKDNKLRATFFYQEPHEVSPGVWLPSRVELKNADGITAAVTTLGNVKVNQGLDDSLFAVAP